MKKIIVLAFFLLVGIHAGARERDENRGTEYTPFKYEVRVGYGGIPVLDVLPNVLAWDHIPRTPELDDLYEPYSGMEYVMSNICAEFDFNLKKWFTLSLTLYTDIRWIERMDGVTNRRTGINIGATMVFLPQARFNYCNRKYMTMYSSIGVGVGYSTFDSMLFPAFQVVPVGLTVGRKVFGFVEICLGDVNLGANAGIGYRF